MFRRIKNIFSFLKFISRFNINEVYGGLFIKGMLNNVENIKKNYDVHDSVYFGSGTQIYGQGKIYIGKASYLGYNCMVQCDPDTAKISIGSGCSISHNVQIRTSTYNLDYFSLSESRKNDSISKDVFIGNDVWIGANVFINPGVRVGNNSIIGANCVVTKDVPENAIFGGVPGKVIKLKSDEKK